MSFAEDNGIDIFDEDDFDALVDDAIYHALTRIINCKIDEFKDEKHMINYIKKIAKNAIDEHYE